MFDIGFWEMLVIGVMALLILGPERLPSAIKSTMSTVRNIKQMATGFKEEVVSQIDAHELHQNLKKAEDMGMNAIGKDLKESVDELKAAAKSVQRPYKNEHDQKDTSGELSETDTRALDSQEQSEQTPKKHIAQDSQQGGQISLLLDEQEALLDPTKKATPSGKP